MTETKLPLAKERDHATARKPAAEGEPGRPPFQDLQQAKLGCVQPVPTPSRQERRTQFGIDCAELVHFTHWEPGVDHIRHLAVKNVVMKTQKIRYKLPQTRYFSMEFPETVTLSAGMSWTIPITFRPVAKEYYNDVIEFTTSFGKFNLPVRASLPEHSLEFPSNIDFSFCPIREIARRTFALKNTGELSSFFEWSIDPPFRIEPRKGELVPGLEVKVTLEFKPLDASVSHAVSVCHFGDSKNWEKSKNAQQMNVSGIGKFSHISIRDDGSRFDFGKVFIGASSTQSFVLENRTTVNANFRIKNAEKDTDPYFTFSLYSGVIPAQGQITVEVTYAPVTGTFSSEYFNITTVSGNTIPITCCGSGIGLHVTLSTKAVNFNDVPAGTAHMRALYLQNHTTCPAFYQFLVEPDSTFQIDKIWGTLNPNSTLALTVRFSPSEPINYYRRVYCLVENQDALHLDLLGTCYTEKRRPATFTYRHLEKYWKRLSNGLTLMSPEQLEDMIKNDSIRTVDGALTYLNRDSQPEHPRDIPSLTDSPIADEYFRENTLVTSEVNLLDAFVEFGACSRYRVIESQVVRIANRTKGKMSCVWVTPGESSGDPIFVVSPRTADILPKSVTEFRVNFLPNMDNSFYGMQLECFVYFKSMRNFRLVNEDTFTPPWCLTCTFSGNTFPPGEDTFIPKIAFHANRLDFPACRIGESVYRAIRLSNTGDTPVKFAFLDLVAQQGSVQQVPSGPDPTLASQNGAFLVKPKCGTLSQNQSQLIVFKFLPSEQRVYEQALKCCFNSSMSNLFEFQMRGAGYVPRIIFENNNMLCFKPTCVSAVTKRSFKARNLSRIPVYFEWQIPQQFAGIVSIEPKTGLLTPNGTLELVCTFAPTTERKWVMKLPCHFSQEPLPDLQNARTRAPLTVIGEGILGRLEADPPVVNCGAVLVNTIAEHETTIFNPSDCDIYYSLEISQLRRRGSVQSENECDSFDNESGDEEIVSHENSNAQIHISQSKSMLPARSHHTVKIRVRLREQTRHEFRVFYRLKAHSLHLTENTVDESTGSYLQDQIIASKIEKYHLCDIIAVGVYPSLQVTDIRSEGICKTRLWQLFSLDTINRMLVSAGASMDIEQATPVLDTLSTQGEETKRGRLIENEYDHGLDVDFGVVPVGTLPTIVHLNLENSGVVPVEWMFHFPDDLEVEIEHWADPGEYTEEQLEQNLILDGNLFNIAPKHGFLKPGESQRVITSYSHEFAGLHRLPVVFKIQNGATTIGREMLLNFQGYSALPQKICLHFHSSKHDFASVDIGTAEPPVQTYELYNGGSVPIYFELDLSPLDRLSKEHSNFPIMSCRTPQGSIGPGESVGLEWVFSPLEARRYEVDIPIKVRDGKTTIVTFRGRGIRNSNGPKGGEAMLVDEIPPIQKLLIPGQIASLSVERIRFGHVPVGSYLRQVVVVRNITKDAGLSFKWNVGQHAGNSVLKVQPSQGKLAAGESRVCKIVLIASMEPRVYLTEISCDFQDDDAMEKYHAEIQEAEKNRRETKLSLAFDRASSAASKRSSPGSAGTSVKSRRSSKYQTLPPITQTSKGGNESANGRRDTSAGSFQDGRSSAASNMSDGAGLMFDCEEPKAFRLYLTVLARSYPMEDYRNRFSDFSTYFRENNAKNCVAGDTDERIESPLDHDPQNTILEMTASLLDDVMQDVEVQNAIELFEAEPLPYFVNLAEKPRGTLSAELAELSEMIREGESDELNVLRSREFQNTLEGVLEGTLFNLVQEMNAGEFNVTVKPAFVSFTGQPPL